MCPSYGRGGGAPPVSVPDEPGPIIDSVDRQPRPDLAQLTARERAIVGIVAQLRAHQEAAGLAALMRDGGEARERVREVLEVLGELDPQLLVQVALDALVCARIDDPAPG